MCDKGQLIEKMAKGLGIEPLELMEDLTMTNHQRVMSKVTRLGIMDAFNPEGCMRSNVIGNDLFDAIDKMSVEVLETHIRSVPVLLKAYDDLAKIWFTGMERATARLAVETSAAEEVDENVDPIMDEG